MSKFDSFIAVLYIIISLAVYTFLCILSCLPFLRFSYYLQAGRKYHEPRI